MLQYELDSRLYILSPEGSSCVLQIYVKGANRVFQAALHFDKDKNVSIQHPPLSIIGIAKITFAANAFKRLVDASNKSAYETLKARFDHLTRHQAKG